MAEKAFHSSKWIWHNEEITENQYAEFFDTILFDGKKTVLRISVRGDYTVFVNGKFAESNQFADFEHYKVYDEIDITEKLEKGENRICFLVWYFGKSGMRHNTPQPGLIYEIESDGKIIAKSSEETKSRKSRAYLSGSDKIISPQLGYSFTYNANLEDKWLTENGCGFEKSLVIGGTDDLSIRPTEKLKLANPLLGKCTKVGKVYLFDFGREIVGLPQINFCTEKAQKINVAYGEVLSGGHVKRLIHSRDFSFDYIAAPGENTYTNYMFRFACRYIEIQAEDEININSVSLVPQYYPVTENKVTFENGLDSKIYEICLNTLKLSMMEHYVDCPWREQCLYAFDARNQMLTGYSAFADGNSKYARANLLLMSKDNREDNILSICFPSADPLTIPSFSLYYIVAVKEYLDHTKDTSLGFEVIEKIESILKEFVSQMKNGLFRKLEGEKKWNFYDWSEYCSSGIGASEDGTDMMINSIAVMALEAYGCICKYLGRKPLYDSIFTENVKKNAKEKFYNREKGIFFISDIEEKPTELVNSLAIVSGISDGNEAEEICRKLVDNSLISCSLSMKVFKYEALLKTSGEYRDAVLEEIRTTYKKMLDFGSTTVWEEIKGAEAFDRAGSLCHGWSAVPIHFYHKLLLK